MRVLALFVGFTVMGCLLCPQPLRSQNGQERLGAIVERVAAYEPYDRAAHPLGKHTEEVFDARAKFAQTQLDSLMGIDRAALSETEQISWELLRFNLQNQVDAHRFKMHLNPILADQGFHLNLNYRIKPLLSDVDAERYLDLLRAIPNYVDEHLALIRKGLDLGISQPKVIFKGYAATYDTHRVNRPEDSAFYAPFLELPLSMDSDRKEALAQEALKVIMEKVVPSFERIKIFFETEYIPNTRTAIGVSETPNGTDFYQNRINYYTTDTQYTAEDIHTIGLGEVARIKGEMEDIIKRLDFKGSFADFLDFLRTDARFYAKTGDELLMHARDIAKRLDAELPKFFKTLPRRPYGVIKVPDALAPNYTSGRYSGPSSDTQPGYYLVNTHKLDSRPLYNLPALTAHEAVPGHHLQGSLNRELGDSIPQFRKNMYLSAYGEGWALYTEFLGTEMGIYTTPYEEFGKLTYEMWRACRLVVDTGIHALGWTREEVVDYMMAHTALSQHEVNTETDRYIAWPGQALSYKMGEIKIRELRQRAAEQLGAKFYVRDFHEVVLEQGTVTLPILEARVAKYINTHR
ncbi:DUF885 domain-containing protein [Maribacter sp. 2307ULW6-5]|uniref:DUF885 domain-containing protein n=1 Tax=Maribacter sp. 2307ULW6-5 TaxID=3386275 RepID=UPI0039BD7F02